MARQTGTRVRILAGMPEFVGLTGTIVGTEKYGRGEPLYFRVRLDEPIEVAHVGVVTDDLWQGHMLKTIR